MRLSDIEDQESAVRALKSSLQRGEIAHAYLFVGPANIGKMATALAFASALNCTNANSDNGNTGGDACGTCTSCRQIEAGTHPDVRIIAPEGDQTKIDQMREMIKGLQFVPLEGRWSVAIIEQADTLNPSSENATLKILEEPPSYAVLILLSCNPTLLLPTIRSRCRIIRFTRASTSKIEEILKRRFDLPDEEIKLIAACSQGAIGRAMRMASDPAVLEDRAAVLGLIRNWPTSPPVIAFKTAETIRKIAEGSQADTDERTRIKRLHGLLDYILSWYSDLLSLKIRGKDATVCNVDMMDDLKTQADLYTAEKLQTAIKSIMDTKRYLAGNITAQLALENMLFDIRPET